MTDRELLELAAKARGITGRWTDDYDHGMYDAHYFGPTWGLVVEMPDGDSRCWNPLTDDGDALRLAVDLEMTVSLLRYNTVRVEVQPISGWPTADHTKVLELRDDKHAATRRAIVLAAAEIGREKGNE